MRTLVLLRHSLTEGNERRLYYGWTDLPLSRTGRELAERYECIRPRPDFDAGFTSGLRRADETFELLMRRSRDEALPDLREMNFGAFEMHSYEELKDVPDYRRWIDDCMDAGIVRCPGGESQCEFRGRVLRGGAALLDRNWQTAVAVLHGGVIANLMAHWFPREPRNFFEWQPKPCCGWRVTFENQTPTGFEAIREA